MNWANKLLVAFIAFGVFIGILIYKSVTVKTELVTADYYNQELKYQDKINGIHNANALSPVSVAQDKDFLTIYLPQEMKDSDITGEAWFYCATDASKDRRINLNVVQNGEQVISKKDLAKGNMQLKLTWKAGDKNYYTEKNVTVN